MTFHLYKQSSPKGNDAHLSAIINLKGLLRCSRAANSTVSGPIRLKFEHNQNIMYVLITYKFKKVSYQQQPRKSGNYNFLDTQGQLTQSQW